jgi:hypothetical protein
VQDGFHEELDAAVIDAGEGVAEVDRYAVAQAGCQPEHALFAAGARQVGVQGSDRGSPVDGGQAGAVAAGGAADEAASEVGAVQEGGMLMSSSTAAWSG